ncbi:phage head closure protein [Pontivivens nitratireducens]|uniref:phage head closure protein n=1 Tax=Pontivivens nitratireducens TaxID=2758038 RepID=UPI001639B60F|nr:phage head closure protein [Pontibrevibacter nitratireducens]
MKSGKLRYTITIQRSTFTTNEYGTPGYTWADLARLRAEQVERSTTEFLKAGADDLESVVFRTRYRDDVKTADRVKCRGSFFNIREIAEIGHRDGMELRCDRHDGEGD